MPDDEYLERVHLDQSGNFPGGEGNLYLGSMQAITSAAVKLVEIE